METVAVSLSDWQRAAVFTWI